MNKNNMSNDNITALIVFKHVIMEGYILKKLKFNQFCA